MSGVGSPMASHWNTAVLPAVVKMSTGRSTKLGGTEHIQMVIYRLHEHFLTFPLLYKLEL